MNDNDLKMHVEKLLLTSREIKIMEVDPFYPDLIARYKYFLLKMGPFILTFPLLLLFLPIVNFYDYLSVIVFLQFFIKRYSKRLVTSICYLPDENKFKIV